MDRVLVTPIALTLLVAGGSAFVNAQRSACTDAMAALPQGLLTIKADRSVSDAVSDWFCSEEFVQQNTDAAYGLDVTVPIDGVPVVFGLAALDKTNLDKRKKFCAGPKRFAEADALAIYAQTLPTAVQVQAVAAWSRCQTPSARGASGVPALSLKAQTQPDGRTVAITLKANKVPGQSQPPTIRQVSTSPSLRCGFTRIKAGTRVPAAGLTETCDWTGDQSASVVVHHSAGLPVTDIVKLERRGKSAGSATVTFTQASVEWRLERRLNTSAPLLRDGIDQLVAPGLHLIRAFRYGGDVTLSVPDGRLVNFTASCVKDCEVAPAAPLGGGPPQNYRGFGAKPRSLGYTTPGDQTKVTATISHWKAFGQPLRSPVWQLSADWERRAPGRRPSQTSNPTPLVYGEPVTFTVPVAADSAEVEFELMAGKLVVKAGEAPPKSPLGDQVELVSSKVDGASAVYVYRVNVPAS